MILARLPGQRAWLAAATGLFGSGNLIGFLAEKGVDMFGEGA